MPGKEDKEDIPWAWIEKVSKIVRDSTTSLSPDYDKKLPVKLLPWLYLSDEKNALDEKKLKELRITHVLSMNRVNSYTENNVLKFYKSLGIVHQRVHALDEEEYNLLDKHWDGECLGFFNRAFMILSDDKKIEKDTVEELKIIVHCKAGMNRSALVCCAAMLTFGKREDEEDDSNKRNNNVLDVVQHVLARRGTILTNQSFQEELCKFAAKHGRLGEKPEGISNDDPAIRMLNALNKKK